MTVTQTIDIPADRRVFFEFFAPREIPAGKTKVEVKLTPVVEKQTNQRSPDQRSEPALNAERSATPHTDALFAIFDKIRADGDIDVDKIREERITAKHLK